MRRTWPVFLTLCMLGGCGSARYEELAREQTELNESLAREWAVVTDLATMKDAEPKLVDLYRRLVRLNREAKGMAKPSSEANEDLRVKFGGRMETAVNKILEEQHRVQDLPGGREFLQRIKSSFENTKAP
jgi:hypothetical protein